MTRATSPSRWWTTAATALLAACGQSEPMGPEARPADRLLAHPVDGALVALPVAGPTWETYGLHWGRAPGGGGGSDDVALRSTPALATKAKAPPASAVRLWLPPGRQVASLGAMSYRFFVEEGDCGGGSPRLAVIVDADGDGAYDVVADAIAGPPGSFTGCGTGTWVHEVATDDDPSWEVRTPQGIILQYVSWPTVVAALTGLYPDHHVLRIQWIQDSFWLFDPLVTWVDDLDLDGQVLRSPGDLN